MYFVLIFEGHNNPNHISTTKYTSAFLTFVFMPYRIIPICRALPNCRAPRGQCSSVHNWRAPCVCQSPTVCSRLFEQRPHGGIALVNEVWLTGETLIPGLNKHWLSGRHTLVRMLNCQGHPCIYIHTVYTYVHRYLLAYYGKCIVIQTQHQTNNLPMVITWL